MSLWQQSLLVFLGAGTGGVARFLLTLAVDSRWKAAVGGLSLGTIAANIIGSTLIGVLVAWGDRDWVRLLLMTGVLGGFTTFSAFSLQTVELVGSGRPGLAAVNVLASLIACIAGAALGMWLGKLGATPIG